MTTRHHRRPLDPRQLAAVAGFVRGYLHEDVLAEHGSAARAAAAFCEDATPEERSRLADGLARLVEVARAWPPARLARFFTRELGAAWTPDSLDAVRELEAIARDACAPDGGRR
jgi:hypothetical protein